jgi:hypothetical protein
VHRPDAGTHELVGERPRGSNHAIGGPVATHIVAVVHDALEGESSAPWKSPAAVLPDRRSTGEGRVWVEPGGDEDTIGDGTSGHCEEWVVEMEDIEVPQSRRGADERPVETPGDKTRGEALELTPLPRRLRCVDDDDSDIEALESSPDVRSVFFSGHEYRDLTTSGARCRGNVLDIRVDATQGSVMKADGDAEPLHMPAMVPGCPMCRPAGLA